MFGMPLTRGADPSLVRGACSYAIRARIWDWGQELVNHVSQDVEDAGQRFREEVAKGSHIGGGRVGRRSHGRVWGSRACLRLVDRIARRGIAGANIFHAYDVVAPKLGAVEHAHAVRA